MLRTVTAVAALCLLLPSTASAGMRASVSFPSEPPVLNSAQAIAALNAQRAANGMRPLVEDSRLSQGCFNHTNAYVQKRGQFPHDEVPGQPGYSEVGDEAAQLSDLGGGGGMWGVRRNPWSGAPLHLYSLFSPYVTNVWYGESQDVKAQSRSTCMGTGVTITQHEPRPTVTTFTSMSYPADGSTGVVPNYSSGEDPFTPAEALGITTDPAGPTIVLYPDETSEQRIDLVSATLQGPDGPVSVKVASPDTPAPAPIRPGWEHWTNVSIGYFAVIERPLKPNTSYRRSA